MPTVEELQGEVTALKAQIAQKDSEIRSLEKDVRERESENFKSRDKLRDANEKNKTLEAELTEAKAKAAVKDGETVLSKADTERWQKLNKLATDRNLKLDDIEKTFGEFDELKTKVTKAERENILREVAEVTGVNLKALSRLAGELEFEITSTTEGDEAVKNVNVLLVDGDKKKQQAFMDYAKTEWAEMLPALMAESENTTQTALKHVRQPVVKPQPPRSKEDAIKQETARLAASGDYSI